MKTLKTCTHCGASVIRKVAPSVTTTMWFCNTSCKAAWQRLRKPVSREWLVEHYIAKKMNCSEIAKLVNRDPKSVWNWLKDFGIETRQRGSNSTNHFVVGAPSKFLGHSHTPETRALFREIAIKDGRLPFDPKVGPPYKGKRGAEIRTWKGGVTPERQAFYSTPEWRAVSKAVRKRDNHTCQRCRIEFFGSERTMLDIHHIVSFAYAPLRADASNLVLLCEPCHYWVHSNANTDRLFIKQMPCSVVE